MRLDISQDFWEGALGRGGWGIPGNCSVTQPGLDQRVPRQLFPNVLTAPQPAQY